MWTNRELNAWCQDVRDRFEKRFGVKARLSPTLHDLESEVMERMMRCGIEARHFGVTEHDSLAILAHHTLLVDQMRRFGGRANAPHPAYVRRHGNPPYYA